MDESKGSKRTSYLEAPEAELFKQEQLMWAKSPTAKFFREDGATSIIKSTEAIANLENRDVLFKGAAELHTPEELLFKGRDISYEADEKKISTEEVLQFESTPQLKSSAIQGTGKGFDANLDTHTFEIHQDVNMTFTPKDSDAGASKVRGNHLKTFSERGWAELTGNVAFQNKNLSMRSDKLSISFDAQGKRPVEEAFFESGEKSRVVSLFDDYNMSSQNVMLHLKNRKEIIDIAAKGDVVLTDSKGLEMTTSEVDIDQPQKTDRRMRLLGNVYIKRGPDEARCNEANFDPVSDEFLLKGNAYFQRGSDKITGDEIRYSQSKGIVQVLKAAGQLQKSHVIPQKDK